MIRDKFIINLIVVCIIIFPGCFEERAKELENKITALEQKVKVLDDNYAELWRSIFDIRSEQNRFNTCHLDLTAKGFQRLDTDVGYFLISCGESLKYLDGYKIFLRVGNPSFVKYSGFKLKVTYGRQFDSDSWKSDKNAYVNWKKSLKEKEITFTDILLPGTWNKIQLILSPAKPEELNYIVVSMEVDKVFLFQKN